MRRSFQPTLLSLLVGGLIAVPAHAQDGSVTQSGNSWYDAAQAQLEERLAQQPNTNVARNVVLLVADGNGVGTNYATRLFQGQQQGGYGDEHVMPKETLPHLALVKTYNVNAQTPDSAGTATAFMAGVKAKAGVIGVDETVNRGDCSQVEAGKVKSITSYMSEAGKSVGIVSTARLTHATPSAAYAHSADRNFEDDTSLPEGCEVPDIASQLLEKMTAGDVDIALGGGRRHFLPADVTDDEGSAGRREDGRNLIEEAQASGAAYAFDEDTLAEIDLTADAPVLGLFESSHMQYEHDRAGEPTLAAMVEAALTKLSANEDGYFLQVEAGRVDHANHDGNLHRTVTDGTAFSDAVAKVLEMTDSEDTLVIVTADHEHAIAFGGYCGRGTPITGLCYGIDNEGVEHTGEPELADDGRPYTVVGYLNGAGSVIKGEPLSDADQMEDAHADSGGESAEVASNEGEGDTMSDAGGDLAAATELLERFPVTEVEDEETGEVTSYRWIGMRAEIEQDEATDPDYLQQALVPKSSETHSGEDVAVYASGPFAHLFDGTIEQNYIFNVMHHAVFGADAD